jgi:hypothetical protein
MPNIYFVPSLQHPAPMTLPDAVRRADECRQFAGVARDAEMRQRWLDMAEEWMRLASKDAATLSTRLGD